MIPTFIAQLLACAATVWTVNLYLHHLIWDFLLPLPEKKNIRRHISMTSLFEILVTVYGMVPFLATLCASSRPYTESLFIYLDLLGH